MGTFFSAQFGKQAAGLLCLAVAVSTSHHLASLENSKPIQFGTAGELKRFAASNDIVFHRGNASGGTYATFFLADHAVTLADLLPVSCIRDCGLTPAWRGILWVSQISNPSSSTLDPRYIGGKQRIWGNVVVAGDEALMDRIEELHRNK